MNPQAFTDATITETVMALKSHNKTAFSRWLEATYLPDEECPPQPQALAALEERRLAAFAEDQVARAPQRRLLGYVGGVVGAAARSFSKE